MSDWDDHSCWFDEPGSLTMRLCEDSAEDCAVEYGRKMGRGGRVITVNCVTDIREVFEVSFELVKKFSARKVD